MSSEIAVTEASIASVDHAITSRMSVRAFTPQEVSKQTLARLLTLASRAPSGTNTQPWKVYVLQGASRDDLVSKVCAAHDALRPWQVITKRPMTTTLKNGSALTLIVGGKTVGVFTVCWVLARQIKTKCTSKRSATIVSLMRQWV